MFGKEVSRLWQTMLTLFNIDLEYFTICPGDGGHTRSVGKPHTTHLGCEHSVGFLDVFIGY